MSWNEDMATFRSNVVAELKWRSFGFDRKPWHARMQLKMSQYAR